MIRLAAMAALIAVTITPPAQAQAYQGQIDGTFHGWDGDTIYRLRDGHVIQQSSYHYHYHYAYAPEVVIYQDGGYKIHVLGDDDDQDVQIVVLR